MNISIIGAAGDVGRTLAAYLVQSDLMTPGDRLQLIGHGVEGTERKLLALRCDLLDAFDETAPAIEVAATANEVVGDIIVMAAGATISKEHTSRRALAQANQQVFEEFATALARNGTGREVVVVVTNPVELGVEIFSRYLERHRVLGMGAQQDSLRFARAIATDAQVRREQVHAWTCGEHGEALVPLWSSVQILGVEAAQAQEQIARLRGNRRLGELTAEVEQHKEQIFNLLAAERIRDAFEQVESLAPDLRIVLEPLVTGHSLHSTANATAKATCDFISALRSGRESVVAAQVRLQGELEDLHTSIGVPVLVNATGWLQVLCPPLAKDEREQLKVSAALIADNLAQWTSSKASKPR